MSSLDAKLLDSYKDTNLLSFLYKNFSSSVPLRIKNIEKLAYNGSKEDLKRELHSLKNTFGNIGSRDSAEFCQELEDQADANLQVVAEKVLLLQAKYKEVIQDFELYLRRRKVDLESITG